MNITKDIISDLFPLYAGNDCSTDTRRLVEEYLRAHPDEAAQFRRAQETTLPSAAPGQASSEVGALRETRRRLRWRSWLMAGAIFFSAAPFSCYSNDQRTWWLMVEAPRDAAMYGAIGICFWIAYAVVRHRSKGI